MPEDSERIVPVVFQLARLKARSAYAVAIRASISGRISSPRGPVNLIPLYSGGLCEAVTMSPPLASKQRTLYWKHGVGIGPISTASKPSIWSVPAKRWLIPQLVVRKS